MMYHNPVLLHPCIDGLIGSPSGTYVDVTFGGGGHSSLILKTLSDHGRLLAFDQDPDAMKNLPEDSRFQFIPYNFCYLKKFLQYYQAYPVDGILADLGVSSYQFDTAERGFSHRFEGQLDMRMNKGKGLTAYQVINEYPLQRLAEVFYHYGELSNARALAHQIDKARATAIQTTTDLVNAVAPLLPKGKENKVLSQIFQALRIEVNNELQVLQDFLTQTVDALKPGGRLVVMSYHSLEDRLVKNFMKSGHFDGKIEKDFYGNPLTPFRLITRKAMIPDDDEIAQNPRARSAKLRIAEKK
ncbi:MAG: 16S rRNA (cytosine(1402)-N(4))-methyltransferase RsmH [Bacteroidales bacterium]|nr:16S rRNA (cytosine(1402)-N(4))-methyltransferase RsmH [Bacteroidales bacterium]